MPLLRVLIVDDERRAQTNLLHLLRREPDLGECRVCDGGEDAIAAVTDFAPQLVFLDVQMPEVDGFEVLRRVRPEHMPPVVFVTAHDAFALRAFEVNAVDYLLEPVSDERFAVAMQRVRTRMAGNVAVTLSRQLTALLGHVSQERPTEMDGPFDGSPVPEKASSRIVVRQGARTLVLEQGEIAYVSAEDYCINIVTTSGTHLVRETLTSFSTQLDRKRFVRVHRSAVVNVDHVRDVRALPSGRIVLHLKGGETLPVSRSRVRVLEGALRTAT